MVYVANLSLFSDMTNIIEKTIGISNVEHMKNYMLTTMEEIRIFIDIISMKESP